MKSMFIRLLGVWWALALFLATFQLYGMLKIWWIAPSGLFLAALIFYLHHLLARYVQAKAGKVIVIIYAFANCVPLLLQLITLKEPGIDNLIAAGIALGLLTTLQN